MTTTRQRVALALLVLTFGVLSWLLLVTLDRQAASGDPRIPVRLIPATSFTRGHDTGLWPASRSFLRSALAPPPPTDPADQRTGGTQPSPHVTAELSPAATVTAPILDPSSPVATRSPDASRKGKVGASGPSGSIRDRIAWCESRNNPRAVNRSSGASGKYQFMRSTWHAVTGLPGDAADYPEAVQDHAFDLLYASSGTRPWASSKTCWSRR